MNFNAFGKWVVIWIMIELCHTIAMMFSHTYRFVSHAFVSDAFEDAGDKGGVSSEDKVHVRVQQRNGRKCITTVAGLADDLDVKRICKAFKKNFSCNGAVQKDEEVGEVIQLSGDQRTNVKDFLVDQEICLADNIVLHGF
jgi:translation initiation factor 1